LSPVVRGDEGVTEEIVLVKPRMSAPFLSDFMEKTSLRVHRRLNISRRAARRQTFERLAAKTWLLGRLQRENKVPSGSALAGWAVWERALEISPRCPTALRACLDTDLRK
jgi:hypothetical protein